LPADDPKPELRKGWKQHLLLSGVPLEYQVASILAAAGVGIDADFSFLRRDGNQLKEWSADMGGSLVLRGSRRQH
jgi:hypothetical protein